MPSTSPRTPGASAFVLKGIRMWEASTSRWSWNTSMPAVDRGQEPGAPMQRWQATEAAQGRGCEGGRAHSLLCTHATGSSKRPMRRVPRAEALARKYGRVPPPTRDSVRWCRRARKASPRGKANKQAARTTKIFMAAGVQEAASRNVLNEATRPDGATSPTPRSLVCHAPRQKCRRMDRDRAARSSFICTLEPF